MNKYRESPGECSSSSSLSIQEDTENDGMIAKILSEEYSNDGSVGRRLSHLQPIPHTPRVNAYIPSANEATFDHGRLLERLSLYGLSELKIQGDGNCQFRALSDQLYHNPEYHKHVRKEVVKQLKSSQSTYECYVPMRYKDYLKKIKKCGEWGDHVTLQAAADRFGAKICLLTSFKDTCLIEIMPKEQKPIKELWLSFWSEVHYNSLYGVGEVPIRVQKKKHWLF